MTQEEKDKKNRDAEFEAWYLRQSGGTLPPKQRVVGDNIVLIPRQKLFPNMRKDKDKDR